MVLDRVCALLAMDVFCFVKQKTAYEIEYGLVGSEMCIRDRGQPRGQQNARHDAAAVFQYETPAAIEPGR